LDHRRLVGLGQGEDRSVDDLSQDGTGPRPVGHRGRAGQDEHYGGQVPERQPRLEAERHQREGGPKRYPRPRTAWMSGVAVPWSTFLRRWLTKVRDREEDRTGQLEQAEKGTSPKSRDWHQQCRLTGEPGADEVLRGEPSHRARC